MERFRGKLMGGDRVLFDKINGSMPIQDAPGLQEWRGRYWLPDSSQVRSGGKYCLIPDHAPAGALIAASAGRHSTEKQLVMFEGNRRFE
jgi:hypothetical protein